jgi:hypothetical protein
VNILEIALRIAFPYADPSDPMPSLAVSRTRSRTYECSPVDAARGSQLYPGRVDRVYSRGDVLQPDSFVCRQRLLHNLDSGARSSLDGAILASMTPLVTDLAGLAASVDPALTERTWLVEAFYPDPAVQTKIAFAAKNALMDAGVSVSDRAPVLGVGDVAVLTRMAPADAYPAACIRYSAIGSIGPDDVLLAVVHRDPRETTLHAGLCVDGAWRWLR